MSRRRKGPAIRCLNALTGTPWAITEGGLRLLLEIAAREHLLDTTLEALEAERGAPLANTQDVTVRDGVATIPVVGPMFRYGDLFTRVSGATSYDTIATDFAAALDDRAVRAILLDINSPGGEVDGISELAQMVYDARGVKPITAYVGGLGASAAYFLASAADEIVARDTAILGSIGVVATLRDARERDAKLGVKSIDIVSSQSPNKRLDPHSDAGRAAIQTTLDALAEVFVAAVATHRGVSVDTVLADFGQGGVFVGQAAVAAGVADRLGSYEAVHAALAARAAGGTAARILAAPRARASTPAAAAAASPAPTMPDETETITEAAAAAAQPTAAEPTAEPQATDATHDAPETTQVAVLPLDATAEQVAALLPTQAAALRTEGASAERTRILGIQALGGDATVLAGCVADPACTREQAALRLIEAGAQQRGARLAALRGDEGAFTPPTPLAEDGAAVPDDPASTAQRVLATYASVAPPPRRSPAAR